jgi:hypothetical protein
MNAKRYLKVKMLNLQQEIQALLDKSEMLGTGTLESIASDISDLTDEIEKLRDETEGRGTEPSLNRPRKMKRPSKSEEPVEESEISLERLYKEITNENLEDFNDERVDDFELLKKKLGL